MLLTEDEAGDQIIRERDGKETEAGEMNVRGNERSHERKAKETVQL